MKHRTTVLRISSNEILQNVMAIKISINIVATGFWWTDQSVTEELVQRIRERMDYYQPMVETDEQLDIQYQGLINRLSSVITQKNEVVTQFPAHFRLYLLTIKLPIVWLRNWRPMLLSTLVVERFLWRLMCMMTLFLSFLKMTASNRKNP